MLHHFRKLQRKTSIVILSFSAVLAACIFFTSAAQSPTAVGLSSIRADELREKVTYIASEKFKGRGNGTRELNQAAEYIAGIFEHNGLKPAGPEGKYYQTFDMYTSVLGTNNGLTLKTRSACGNEPEGPLGVHTRALVGKRYGRRPIGICG